VAKLRATLSCVAPGSLSAFPSAARSILKFSNVGRALQAFLMVFGGVFVCHEEYSVVHTIFILLFSYHSLQIWSSPPVPLHKGFAKHPGLSPDLREACLSQLYPHDAHLPYLKILGTGFWFFVPRIYTESDTTLFHERSKIQTDSIPRIRRDGASAP
jgi:hypothetical protein